MKGAAELPVSPRTLAAASRPPAAGSAAWRHSCQLLHTQGQAPGTVATSHEKVRCRMLQLLLLLRVSHRSSRLMLSGCCCSQPSTTGKAATALQGATHAFSSAAQLTRLFKAPSFNVVSR